MFCIDQDNLIYPHALISRTGGGALHVCMLVGDSEKLKMRGFY